MELVDVLKAFYNSGNTHVLFVSIWWCCCCLTFKIFHVKIYCIQSFNIKSDEALTKMPKLANERNWSCNLFLSYFIYVHLASYNNVVTQFILLNHRNRKCARASRPKNTFILLYMNFGKLLFFFLLLKVLRNFHSFFHFFSLLFLIVNGKLIYVLKKHSLVRNIREILSSFFLESEVDKAICDLAQLFIVNKNNWGANSFFYSIFNIERCWCEWRWFIFAFSFTIGRGLAVFFFFFFLMPRGNIYFTLLFTYNLYYDHH